MKTLIIRSCILISFVILSNTSVAQQEKINPGEKPAQLNLNIPPEKSFASQRIISAEEKKLSEQLLYAKETGGTNEMMRIQKQLDAYAGSVTAKGTPAGKSERIYGSLPPEQNINVNKISDKQGILALAVHKEQIGTSNRMWAVISASSWGNVDTIYALFSDDDGNNWNYFSRSYFNNSTVNSDQMDVEIVQTPSEKYIYIVCGIRYNLNGKRSIGLIINQVNSPGYAVNHLNWPGDQPNDLNIIKYRPRITSDVAQFQYGSAWIYIACCQDSVVSGGYRTCVKVARINNPYGPFPAVTYKPEPFFFNDPVTVTDAYVDLAYYNDGTSAYVMVLQSNVPVNSNLYLTKSGISTFTSFAVYAGSLNGGTTRRKWDAFISSNGYYPNLMITNIEKYSENDYDVQVFSSTNGGYGWTSAYIDYSGNQSYSAKIMERKNVPGEFYTAYGDIDSFYVQYCKATGNSWGTVTPKMNHIYANPTRISPCYKTTGSDNCFAIWTEVNSYNVWASGGCSGIVTPIRNLQLNLFIQGRYQPAYDYMIGDTFTVQLRSTASPYTIITSVKSFQKDNGVGSYNFAAAVNGVNYYIVVKHRNSIETWSKSPGQSFSANVLNYNFFNFAQAYGNNLVEVDYVPYRFGIYTGDVNQDGIIEGTDVALIDNAARIFQSGYVQTELTGDYFVDGSDYLIADNNAFNFVSVRKP